MKITGLGVVAQGNSALGKWRQEVPLKNSLQLSQKEIYVIRSET